MALIVKDRVRETSTTTGTGAMSLVGAVAGFQAFTAIGDGNTTYYAIVDASTGNFEVGLGTFTASGATISRDTVIESSNSGSLVNFGTGIKDVFCTYPAEKAVYTDADDNIDGATFTTPDLGTPSAATLTNATGLPIEAGTTGILSVARGGTNATTATDALTNLGAYPATNPDGYTTNTGTVTSVSGTGTVNGISLNGTVTETGDLTLGGALTGVDLTTQITGTLPVSNGGTGITTFGTGVATALGQNVTGSGGVVLSTSPILVTPTLGIPSSGNLSSCTVDGTTAVGFRTIPQNSRSAAYTLVLTDSGKHIFHPSADTTARTFTIPANSSVAFPIGTAITFINQNNAGVVTIAITTDTMRLSPDGTTGSRTLDPNGSATCVKITSTEWIISGSGLT